jgi:hypothetical protein
MGGTGGAPENGWLREYLRGIRDELGALREQVGDVQQRVSRIEASQGTSRRLWNSTREWLGWFVALGIMLGNYFLFGGRRQ